MFGQRRNHTNRYELYWRATQIEVDAVGHLTMLQMAPYIDVFSHALKMHEETARLNLLKQTIYIEDRETAERRPHDPYLYTRDSSEFVYTYSMAMPNDGRLQKMVQATRIRSKDPLKTEQDVMAAAVVSLKTVIDAVKRKDILLLRDDVSGVFTPFYPIDDNDDSPEEPEKGPSPASSPAVPVLG